MDCFPELLEASRISNQEGRKKQFQTIFDRECPPSGYDQELAEKILVMYFLTEIPCFRLLGGIGPHNTGLKIFFDRRGSKNGFRPLEDYNLRNDCEAAFDEAKAILLWMSQTGLLGGLLERNHTDRLSLAFGEVNSDHLGDIHTLYERYKGAVELRLSSELSCAAQKVPQLVSAFQL